MSTEIAIWLSHLACVELLDPYRPVQYPGKTGSGFLSLVSSSLERGVGQFLSGGLEALCV